MIPLRQDLGEELQGQKSLDSAPGHPHWSVTSEFIIFCPYASLFPTPLKGPLPFSAEFASPFSLPEEAEGPWLFPSLSVDATAAPGMRQCPGWQGQGVCWTLGSRKRLVLISVSR
jgi:hypothetical protein